MRNRGVWWKKAISVLGGLPLFLLLMWAAGPVEAEAAAGPMVGMPCIKCHSSAPDYPIRGARMGYDKSGHKNNGNSAYSNAEGCQQCHTHEGFLEYVAKGSVNPKGVVRYPSQPGCFTCHAPHETGDMSLRTVKPVKIKTGDVFDLGSGNLCANCHQARVKATDMVKPMAANTISGPWGAHHGPQADMILGKNAFQDPRRMYSSSPHGIMVKDGCVSCHMSLPDARYGFSPEVGGHSFRLAGEVHEAEKLNTSGCITCHQDMKQAVGSSDWSRATSSGGVTWVKSPAVFSIKARADYDQNGKIEYVQDEVQGLMDKLVNKSGTGLLQKTTPPFYGPDGAYIGNQFKDSRPLEQVAALYNYKFVLEDRSRGVHNAIYTIQILYDAIALLDPNFSMSSRP